MTHDISAEAQTDILVRFREDRFASIVDYTASGDEEGRWVDKQMQFSTNRIMLAVAILELLVFFLIHRYMLHSHEQEHTPAHHLVDLGVFVGIALSFLLLATIIRGFSVRVFCAAPFRITAKQLRSSIRETLVREAARERGGDNPDDSSALGNGWFSHWAFITWQRFLFFSPFSYRFIWWWTLIVGIASAEMEYFVQLRSSPDQHIALHPSDLGISFMRAIIVSVIAYIATNIIRELLYLREYYIEGKDEARGLSRLLKKFSPIINETYGVLTAAVGVLGTGVKLKDFAGPQRSHQNAPFREQSDKFLKNISDQIDNFVKQLDEALDQHVKLWLIVTLNTYIETQRRILNTDQKHLLTRFSDLARITRELVAATYPSFKINDIDEGIEFFALLVIPPEKFLNFTDKKYMGDCDWESYLSGNIKAASGGVRQNRYFLSIRAPAFDLSKSEEAYELCHDFIKEQLKRFVQLKEQQFEINSDDSRPIKAPCKETVSISGVERERYVIEKEKRTDGEWQSLGTVIGTIYHVPGSCYIREFSKDEYEQHLIDDKGSKKPLDYFAIKKNEVWKLCLQTRYDKSFDIADIEIYHDEMKDPVLQNKWADLKNKLDLLFPSGRPTLGKTIRIEEYES